MEVCGRGGRSSKASDVPMRIRRRQSDARWRANVASCFETLKNIIPVNKRASKRQISKAYILQETSKHINFLEGILCTLIQEKANIDGAREDSCFNQFQTVKDDFILNQQLKLEALNNERKYKRNKYKIYISDHLAYANDQRPSHGNLNRRRAPKPRASSCTCNPGLQNMTAEVPGVCAPVIQRGRGKVCKEQPPPVRIYVRPPKRMKIGLPQIKTEPPDPGDNPLIVEEHQTQPTPEIPITLGTPTLPQTPTAPSRRKQKVPRKRKNPADTKRVDTKKKGMKYTMTSINSPGTKGCEVETADGPFLTYQMVHSDLLDQVPQSVEASGIEATEIGQDLVLVPGLSLGLGPVGLAPRPPDWETEVTSEPPTPEHAPPSLPLPMDTTLQVTPLKSSAYPGTKAHSTPTRPSQPIPALPLSPLMEEPVPTTPLTTVIHSTPVKSPSQENTHTGGGFTPVSLPKAWMTTPSGQSPRTPDNMNTPICQFTWNEPKRLECDEDISSEDEDTKKGPKSPVQSQSLHHRESKQNQGSRCPNSGPVEQSKTKYAPRRSENMKCRRSLNMSLDCSETNTSTPPEFTSFTSETEACIQDFDRYYQQLKDSRLNSPDTEPGEKDRAVGMSPVWRLVEEVTCLNHPGPDRHDLCTTLEYSHHLPDQTDQQLEDQEVEDDFNPFLTGRLDVNATDEYVPQDSTYVDDGQVPDHEPVDRDIWQVVPKAPPPQPAWTDCLDVQLVPDKPWAKFIKTEPDQQVHESHRGGWTEGPDNQLVPEQLIMNEGSESFRADVLRFIKKELLGHESGLGEHLSGVISEVEVTQILEQLSEQQGAGRPATYYKNTAGGKPQSPYMYNGEDGLVLWDMSPDS